jgi:hypothetical protein
MVAGSLIQLPAPECFPSLHGSFTSARAAR